jgi:hypothetical protein
MDQANPARDLGLVEGFDGIRKVREASRVPLLPRHFFAIHGRRGWTRLKKILNELECPNTPIEGVRSGLCQRLSTSCRDGGVTNQGFVSPALLHLFFNGYHVNF